MTVAAFIREKATDDHRAVARDLATALALQSSDGMAMLAQSFRERLSPGEAVMVAWAALKAVSRRDVDTVLSALPEDIGPPPAAFDLADVMGDAGLWAVAASVEERRAYAMAALAQLPEEERQAIVRALDGRAG